jgi:hypothetical protein
MSDDSSTAAYSKRSKGGYRRYLRAAYRLSKYGALGWFTASWFHPESTFVARLVAITIFLLAFTANTAAHELGHLAASHLVGFRFASISVFPLALVRGLRGWKVRLGRVLGQCLAFPTDARDLRRRCIVYLSGGVVSGFATTAIAAVVLRLGAVPPGELAGFLGWYVWIGLVLNTMSLIPLGGASDGFNLSVLRRPGPQADQLIAAFTAHVQEMVGTRYRDMDRVLADALTLPACTPRHQLIGQDAAYCIALDSGRLGEARALLGRLWELTAETPWRPKVALELAYFAAAHEKDAAAARRHLETAEDRGSRLARASAVAAILIEEGRAAAALAELDAARGEVRVAKREDTGSAQLMIARFDDLAARAGGESQAQRKVESRHP